MAVTVTFNTPGTHSFVVPGYKTMSVEVRGGGGGGANPAVVANADGAAGQGSSFGSGTPVQAGGGAGGYIRYQYYAGGFYYIGYVGGDGSASGGDTNTAGGASNASPNYTAAQIGNPVGGSGGRAVKAFTAGAAGAPTIGTTITVVVGDRGLDSSGSAGAGLGSVTITYDPINTSTIATLNLPMLGM